MFTNLKTIAVFFDGTAQGRKIAEHAADLAYRYGAHLIGLYELPRLVAADPADCFVRGEQAICSVIARGRAAGDHDALAVARGFAALASKQGVSAEFRMIRSDREDDAGLNALHCDLVVIGHPTPAGVPGGWSLERLLTATGVPVLIIPDRWASATIGNKVLVAWNLSREARRALADAMPFLVAAHDVTVLVVDPAASPGKHGEEPGADIALFLARHGVRVTVERAVSAGSSIADVILAHAVDHGMGLIVMGAYSHARWAELVFGGVTQTLLARMPVPVLMSR